MVSIQELDITENIRENEADALRTLVRQVCCEGVWMADVGCWKGFSSALIGTEIKEFHGNVIAVDNWQGNEGTWNYDIAHTKDISIIFKRNMQALGLEETVHALNLSSQGAVDVLLNDFFSLVFLDADHRYSHIKEDIVGWLRKLKVGGILCGHDCEGYYNLYEPEERKTIDSHLEEDCFEHRHSGVIKAVHEQFQDNFSIVPGTRIWYHIKQGDK